MTEKNSLLLHSVFFLTWLSAMSRVCESSNRVLQELQLLTNQVWMKGKVDIVFLLDRSGSVGAASFEEEKGFVESLLTHMAVSPNATRVAVISYSADAIRHIDYLKDPKTKCFLNEDLHDVVFKDSGKTNIEAALQEAEDVFKNARPDAKKVVMLLSDGLSNHGEDPLILAEKLKQNNVEIFTFGIGRFLRTQLQAIASSPSHFYDISDFKEFRKLAEQLRGDSDGIEWSDKEGPRRCDQLCDSPYKGMPDDPGCCDSNAKCSCGLVAGTYRCVCAPGYYGVTGLIGDCRVCPIGTYKEKYDSTESCTPCPPHATTRNPGSTSIDDCKCQKGYEGDLKRDGNCSISQCPPVQPPINGFIVGGSCNRKYGSVCNFGCNDGYELKDPKDSATRICMGNREWSGKTPFCQERRCPNFPQLKNGQVTCTELEPIVGTTCTLSCNEGHFLIGSSKTTCTKNRRWSTTHQECGVYQCFPPPSIPHGTLLYCAIKKRTYEFGHVCIATCDAGYKLISDNLLICGDKGAWTAKRYPQCKDVEKPKIDCPASRVLLTDPGKSYAMFEFPAPTVSDNSGKRPRVRSLPENIISKKIALRIGKKVFHYYAEDDMKNKNFCSFTLTVKDKEAPKIVSCPSRIEVNTTELEEPVYWEEPIFSDNSKSIIKIQQTAKPGTTFQVGRHTVHYVAEDQSGNMAKCSFDVIVNKLQCKFYPAPANGAVACDDWLYGQFCQVYCEDTFDFTSQPAEWYICEDDLKWSTDPPGLPVPWPDCGELHLPNKVRRLVSSHYYAGKCQNAQVQESIKTVFVTQFLDTFNATAYCRTNGSCTIRLVKVTCGIKDNFRVRRDTESVVEEILDVEAEVMLTANDKYQNSKEYLDQMIHASEEIVTHVQSMAVKQDISPFPGDVTRPLRAITVEVGEPQIICNSGSVRNEANECVTCPVGTFHNEEENICQECPFGTYQDEESQTVCKNCPPGTWTEGTHIANVTDCKDICIAGTFSSTGLETCEACPVGTYQDQEQQTTCKTCPSSTTTFSIGSASPDDCKEKCLPGTFSDYGGLQPCAECPIGFYQSQTGQTECTECPEGLSTFENGRTSINDCIELNHCNPDPCLNGGNCTSKRHAYRCECAKGFTGVSCEENVDDCASEPCLNGGSCIDQVNDFLCSCPERFTGRYCEEEIDKCRNEPCKNGGTCLHKVSGFTCICRLGFAGDFCEKSEDACELLNCRNGATCVNIEDEKYCLCPPGFEGMDCSEKIDDCQGIDC